MIGKTLGHYQITEKLGEGGMGVVYKARDTHLDRFVALKVLPPERVSDPDRKRRFIQEAKAASALNHPSIITIHDIDHADGVDYIAMEYVAGKTLDELIPRKGMRLSLALKYAVQIADALARAHGAGIIHRDLKPSNVMVDEHGLVKVLDFGLAKLTETAGPDAETATTRTGAGMVLGTPAYMSPEQAEAKKVDARSDIFSFGAVLYEMVSGRRAFQGDSNLSTLSAVLHQEPKPIEDTSHDLEKVVTRCLRKEPERRFQTMADLKVALQELKDESDSGRLATPAGEAAQPRTRWVWIAIGSLLLAFSAATWRFWPRGEQTAGALQAVPLTTYQGSELEPTLSLDGNEVAFAWDGEKQDNFDIYRKLIGPGPPLRLTANPAEERSPAWSPDGKWIAFVRYPSRRKAEIVLMPALGGPERKLTEVEGSEPPMEGIEIPALAWSPDSNWLAVSDANLPAKPGLALLSIRTGEKRQITEGSGYWDLSPSFSPDGRGLTFVRAPAYGLADVYIVSLSEALAPQGPPRPLTSDHRWPVSPVWAAAGRDILFTTGELMAGRSLWRVDAAGGSAQRVPGAGEDGHSVTLSRRPGATQRLVYSRALFDVNVWGLDMAPGERQGAATPRITSTYRDLFPAFSPDGARIAFTSDRSGSNEIWVCNRDGSNPVQLTSFGRGVSYFARWCPDGRRIVFSSRSSGQEQLYMIDASGGTPQRLTRLRDSAAAAAFSPDGKWIYFTTFSDPTPWKSPADDPDRANKLQVPLGWWMSVSPDGRFLYYIKRQTAGELWRVPLDAQGEPAGPETLVVKTVYPEMNYAVVDGGVYWTAPAADGGQASVQFLNLATSKTREILKLDKRPFQGFSATRDGGHILWAQVDQSGSDLMLVENFQ